LTLLRIVTSSRGRARLVAVLLAAALPAMLFPATAPASEGVDDLLGLMTRLQTLSHKLQLSLEAGNRPLAAFYAHELEEVAEAVAEVTEYDGYPVGALTRGMLLPQIEAVAGPLADDGAAGGLEAADQAYDGLLLQCNACHEATGHPFVVIERNPANPYAQSFAPR
jgi:hypothetical protein